MAAALAEDESPAEEEALTNATEASETLEGSKEGSFFESVFGELDENSSTFGKAWYIFKIIFKIVFGIILLVALLPIVPFWIITYYSFWGRYGILRFALNNFRNF